MPRRFASARALRSCTNLQQEVGFDKVDGKVDGWKFWLAHVFFPYVFPHVPNVFPHVPHVFSHLEELFFFPMLKSPEAGSFSKCAR